MTTISSVTAERGHRYDAASAGAPPHVALELMGLTKRFARRRSMAEAIRSGRRAPRVTVVDGVSFAVSEGEIFGLLGPNGAGKTTIFKMLATMIAPDAGTAGILGHDVVDEASAVRRVLAAVPSDERSLNWRLSAHENLALFGGLHHLSRHDSSRRAQALLISVGLADVGSKIVGAFSSGMRQRLLIARALLGRPRVLLLDEPTRSLDPISAQEFRAFLRRDLVGREGCTIVLATHNADEAFGICDRVAVLHQGRVLATGAAEALAARYGEERYRLLTREPSHPAFAALERQRLLRVIGVATESSAEWGTVECAIPGGPLSTSAVVGELIARGVSVARLERSEVSLADLIGRIIAGAPGSTHA